MVRDMLKKQKNVSQEILMMLATLRVLKWNRTIRQGQNDNSLC